MYSLQQEKDIKNICIIGEISDDTAMLIPELMEINFEENKIKQINVYICSEGGYLSSCFAIIDFLTELKKQYEFKIKTFGLGEIASAGFFLFLLGDERVIYPNCRVFVHEHITINDEPKTYSRKLKEDKTIEKEIYNMYLEYTAKRLNLTKTKAKNFLAKEKWLTKKEIEHYKLEKVNDE